MLFNLPLSNGSSVYNITGGVQGLAQLTYSCSTYPTAGTVKLEYQVTGSSAWALATGTNTETSTQSATGQANWELYGAIANLRVTFAGLSGGSVATLAVTHVDMRGHPYGVYQGLRAITVQSYAESNSKRGVQFEASFLVTGLANNANSDVLLITGALPVIMKDRQVGTDASLARLELYAGPTATQGAVIPIYNLCLTPSVGLPSLTTMKQATVTATGTKVGADTYVVGTEAANNRSVGVFMNRGAERVLLPNTTYLYRVTNLGGTAANFGSYWSFYEGLPDLPLS